MDKKTYIGFTSYIFLTVAIVHLLRIVNDWSFVVGETVIPMWVSWVGVFFIGYMAWLGFGFSKK